MSEPHELSIDELAYMHHTLRGHFESVMEAKALTVPGSLDWRRCEVAEASTGWFLGWIEFQLKYVRTDDAAAHWGATLDAEIREFLDNQ